MAAASASVSAKAGSPTSSSTARWANSPSVTRSTAASAYGSTISRRFHANRQKSLLPRVAVHRIDPQHRLRLFHRIDLQIDRDRLAVAAHQHAFQRLVATGVDFLMRHIGRNENEIAGIRLRSELQVLAP